MSYMYICTCNAALKFKVHSTGMHRQCY